MDDVHDPLGLIRRQIDDLGWPAPRLLDDFAYPLAVYSDLLETALGPLRAIQGQLDNSGVLKLQEQMRDAVESSGIRGLMDEIAGSTSAIQDELKSLQLDTPELLDMRLDGQAQRMLDALTMPALPSLVETYKPLAASLDPELFSPPTRSVHEMGEAARVLATLEADHDALAEQYRNNPSKAVQMTVTLADGSTVILQTARNIGNYVVELTGVDVETGEERKLEAGIGSLSFEAKVLDFGPRRPSLELVESHIDGQDE